jgi:retron-type reverse transcriptase
LKRHGNLWNKIISYDNLHLAYKTAKRGKGTRTAITEFEKDIKGNLLRLQDSLIHKTFTTSKYKSKTIYEPKIREIYILPFYPDRIVQHALLQIIIPIWDNLMIFDSYACRMGKGMHQASSKTMGYVKKYEYCLKCDIKKFYPSIKHKILIDIVERKIKCKDTLWLLKDIINSFDGEKNTPIGNYTSQWFGNLYMNEVDTYVKNKKYKAYIRYCDDFVIFSDDKKDLHVLKLEIEDFLLTKLSLKFSRWSIFNNKQGVDFLGYRHFSNKILLRKTTSKRVMARIKELPKAYKNGIITIEQFESSLAATMGWIKWANTFNLQSKLKLKQLKQGIKDEKLSKAHKQ